MTGGPPSRYDRAALERILQRAAELQAGERDLGEQLSPDDVLALGREVGIPQRYLQQAMVEERARIVSAALGGTWDRIAGPGQVLAQRVVPGESGRVAESLTEFLEEHEPVHLRRRQPGHLLFEPVSGFQAAIRRSTQAFGRKPFLLSGVSSVTAAFTQLEAGYTHVALQADLRAMRSGFVGGGAAMATTGLAATTVLLVLSAFPLVALAPLPLGLGAGWAVMRQFSGRVPRVQLGLECALDHLEEVAGRSTTARQLPPRPAGILGLLLGEVRRNIRG